MRQQRGEVAAGAGGDPAAEGRVLERLREVPEREVVLAQLVLEPRAGRARLDPGRARGAVDLEHAVERLHVHRDRAFEPARLDAAHDARAAAVRDHRHVVRARPVEQALELVLVAGMHHGVGWVVELAAEAAHDVAIRLPQRVRRARVAVHGRDLGQRVGDLDPRRAQRDVLERDGPLDLGLAEPEVRSQAERRLADLLERRLLILVAPPPVLEPPIHGRSLARRGLRALSV